MLCLFEKKSYQMLNEERGDEKQNKDDEDDEKKINLLFEFYN